MPRRARTLVLSTLVASFALGALALAPAALAQPSDARILSVLKKEAHQKATIKFTGKRGKVKREVEGRWEVSNFYRWYEATWKTEHKGVKAHYKGGVKWGYRNGGWKQITLMVGDTTYTGIPNPKWEDLERLLRADMPKTLGFDYNKIVGDIEVFALADDPAWLWHKPTSVSFKIKTRYHTKVSYTDLAHVEQLYEIRLYADAYQGPWKKWNSKRGKTSRLGVKKYAKKELDAMRTLRDADIESATADELAGLPDVTVPDFPKHADLQSFVWNMLMTADGPTIEATLRKLLAPGYFDPHMKTVLNGKGAAIVKAAVAKAPQYRAQYCPKPAMKHEQSGMTQWWNKAATRYTRLSSANLGEGRRGIGTLEIWLAKTDKEAQQLAALPCKVRGSAIARMSKTELVPKVGATVFVNYKGTGRWYVARLTGSAGGKYQIQYLDGSRASAAAKDVVSFELQPGDVVYSSVSAPKRWVTEFNSSMVRMEDATGRTMDVPLKKVFFQ